MQYCNKCATKTERKEFKTFAYDWCPKCRDEVKPNESKELAPLDKARIDLVTPSGFWPWACYDDDAEGAD